MQADLGVVVRVCAFRIVIHLLTVGYSHVLMNGFGIYDGKRYGFQGNVHKLMRINRQLSLYSHNNVAHYGGKHIDRVVKMKISIFLHATLP